MTALKGFRGEVDRKQSKTRMTKVTYTEFDGNRPFYGCLLGDLAFEWQRG